MSCVRGHEAFERSGSQRRHARSQEWPECVVGKDRRQVSPPPACGCLGKRRPKREVLFLELCSELGGRRMAPRTASPFRTVGAMVGILGEHTPPSKDARVVSPPLVVHRLQYSFQESTPGGASGEPDDRQGPELEGLLPCKARVEPTGHTVPRPSLPPLAPVEPAELSRRLPPEIGKTAQAGPLLTVADQALLHAVGEDVAKAVQEPLLVQHRLRRVPALPERASPVHECSHLLRDVREKVLHELREVPPGCSHEQVQVIRGEAEGKELHPKLAHRPSEYTPEDVVRPRGWTEKQASLQAAYGCKDDSDSVRSCATANPFGLPPVFENGEHESGQRTVKALRGV